MSSPKLIIMYDPTGELSFERAIADLPPDIKPDMAMMPLAEDLENRDIYEIARKLAELLLEQL
jgi:hypothetical protein